MLLDHVTQVSDTRDRVFAGHRAVEVLTRYLAKELGPRRIADNVVASGAIETDFSGGLVRDNPDFNRRVPEMTALGRAGVSDDIGPTIASLVSRRVIGSMRSESRFRGVALLR